jgi:hypothetical protein
MENFPNPNYCPIGIPDSMARVVPYLRNNVSSYYMKLDDIEGLIKLHEEWFLENSPIIMIVDFQNIYLVDSNQNSEKIIPKVLTHESTASYNNLRLLVKKG